MQTLRNSRRRYVIQGDIRLFLYGWGSDDQWRRRVSAGGSGGMDVIVVLEVAAVVAVLASCVGDVAGVSRDVCSGYDFTASCKQSEVLVTETAEFGRMKEGRCITSEFGFIGCTNDVTHYVDRVCSGRQTCSLRVTNDELEKANRACNANLKAYLQVVYTCVKVNYPSSPCHSGMPSPVMAPQGVLASHVTNTTSCGSAQSPWRIQGRAGQTIDLTLVDFQALERQATGSGGKSDVCSQVYGYVTERALEINQTICGSSEHETAIYRSKTNQLSIHLKRHHRFSFLIKYKMIGCADVTPPKNARYTRDGDEATIACKNSRQQWQLKCSGTTWEGKFGNCTTAVVGPDAQESKSKFEFSTVVVVASIVGVTVVLAVALVVGGTVYLQKYRARRDQKAASKAGSPKPVVRRRKRKDKKPDKPEAENARPASMPTETAPRAHFRPVSGDYLQPQPPPRHSVYSQSLHVRHSSLHCCPEDDVIPNVHELVLTDPRDNRKSREVKARSICNHRDSQLLREVPGEMVALNRDKCGSSYYSPQTGHKYYVLERGGEPLVT